MGNSATKATELYATPVSEPKEGETAIYRNAKFNESLPTAPEEGIDTYSAIVRRSFLKFANKPFLGHRAKDAEGNLAETYTWETYREVELLGKNLGSGMQAKDLIVEKAQYEDYKLKFVGVYSVNTREWVLLDIACALYGYTLVPIYDTLGEEATQVMFEETETPTLFLTCKHVAAMAQGIKAGNFPHLKNLVVLDAANLTDALRADLEGINHFTLEQVIEAGAAEPKEYAEVTPDDISFFSYTSGTTGRPKGAMISQRNLASAVAGADIFLPPIEMVHISYLPLAHVFERVVYAVVTFRGGQYGLFSGDTRKIKDDLAVLKPTIFVSVPRMFNKFYDVIKGQIHKLTGIKGAIARRAVSVKLANHRNDGSVTHRIYDNLVFNKMKTALGGNVKYCLTGSAPISSEVREFLKIAFGCAFAEGYGQTEGMAAEFVTGELDNTFGHVGGCLPQNEFKLVDVPSMSYFATDKDSAGRLAPRGEIWVRGGNVIPGYYKNKEKTAETITEDGWLKSGDIGMVIPGTNALKIIDRVKNIFKLSQGEYVAPDKLEQAYKSTRGVSDIYVYGDSTKSSLISVIYVEDKDLEAIAQENGIEGTAAELRTKPEIADAFIKAFEQKKKDCGLKGFERLVKVHITDSSFENLGLLTTTFKVKRHVAKEHFQEVLDKMYEGLN